MSQQISKEVFNILNAIAEILLRCFIITVLALLFVWIVVFWRGDFMYQVQTFFPIFSHFHESLECSIFLVPFYCHKAVFARSK